MNPHLPVPATGSPPGDARPRLRRMALPAALVAGVIVALSAPQVAHAYTFQRYAANYPLKESTMKYSAVATVNGGRAYLSVSTLPRTYIQTLSGSVLVASSWVDGGATANLAHASYAGARSRCYWDYLGGTIAGSPSININCWRRI